MRSLIIPVFILALSGCGPENTRTTSQAVPTESRITRFLDAGEYQLAAEESIRLAGLYPDDAIRYLQQATEIYLDAGDLFSAKVALERIPEGDRQQEFNNRLLKARIALLENNLSQALSHLQDTPPVNTPPETILRYYRTRIEIFNRRGSSIDEISNRLLLNRYLADGDELTANSREIWSRINEIPLPLLRQYRLSGDANLKSWIELAIINQTLLFKPELLEQSVSMWKQQYPDHPALGVFNQVALPADYEDQEKPQHIALCLPFSGIYKGLSQAIRDGFLAAWFTSTDYRPEISIYDSDTLNIAEAYQKAVTDGAELIVGPLEKNAITNLLENNELVVPVLALNQIDSPLLEKVSAVDGSDLPQLIQFGFSPEDEARQIATRATEKGYKKALIITPNNERGDRLFNAFQEQLEHTNGIIMEHIRYPVDSQEYKTPVKSLLNISSSEKRRVDLRNRLGRNINGETRLRGDADFIFMVADPGSARRIIPEFKFYRAGVPVYSTSDIYNGIKDPLFNKDMDGVIFTHIPWIMDDENHESNLQQLINSNWAGDKSPYRRYYALGIDAYQLVPNLARMVGQNTVKYPGHTGDLYLSENGRIQRDLVWATFADGTAKPVEY